MSQQGLRQASARAATGSTVNAPYNEDLFRLFRLQATIPAGATFNEAMLIWINSRMGVTYTNLPEAMQAYAESAGAYNWSSLGSLSTGGKALLLNGQPITLNGESIVLSAN